MVLGFEVPVSGMGIMMDLLLAKRDITDRLMSSIGSASILSSLYSILYFCGCSCSCCCIFLGVLCSVLCCCLLVLAVSITFVLKCCAISSVAVGAGYLLSSGTVMELLLAIGDLAGRVLSTDLS